MARRESSADAPDDAAKTTRTRPENGGTGSPRWPCAPGERAQSHTVGVILLTAVIVILMGIFGMVYLGATNDRAASYGPLVDADVNATVERVTVAHGGGDSIAFDELDVVVRVGGSSERFTVDAANVTGDGDDRFEPTERFAREHGQGSGEMEVLAIHTPSNTVLAHEYLTVRPGGGTGTGPSQQVARWETAGDWDVAVSQDGVVHEGFGDRRADAVELGYPSGGQWGPTPIAYWPMDEDSGTTTMDVVGSNDGTVQGATIGEPGTLGTTAYDFDATTDEYIDGATDLEALRGTATVSVWINSTQSGDDTTWQAPGITGVESNGDGDDVFWGWLDSNGQIGVQSGDVAGATSTTAVNDGSWYHVVLTRNQSTGVVEVYVDGALEDTATSRTGEVTNTFSSIGRIEDTGGSPEYFDGRIEDLVVYDRVLSAGEVSTLHAAGETGTLTTGTKTLSVATDPSTLALQNVSASLPPGTEVTVTVHSDPDGDGTFEESADAVTLQPGTTSYAVSGLSADSRHYRLELDLASTDPTVTPAVDRLEVAGAGT